jgi:hypothetical protein
MKISKAFTNTWYDLAEQPLAVKNRLVLEHGGANERNSCLRAVIRRGGCGKQALV